MKAGFVVPVREKLAFGLGDTANNLSYTALQFYFMFFLLSVAMVGIGLIGEYVGRTYQVVRARQRYFVKEIFEAKA